MRAAIGHKNLLSIYLVLTFPWLYYLFFELESKIAKFALVLYLAISIGLIFLCQSRVGMLGAVIYLIIISILIINQYRQFVFHFVVSVLVLLPLLHFTFKSSANYQRILKRSVSIFYANPNIDENSQSVKERKVLWSRTMDMIADNPILGKGLGQWKLHIGGYDINETRSKFGNIIFQQPHNDFLWIAAEYGIIGLILFIGLLAFPFISIWQKKNKEPIDDSLFVFFILYIVVSFFDFPKERPHFLWILSFALAVVSYRNADTFSSVKKWPTLIAFLVCLVFFGNRILTENKMTQLIHYRQNGNQNEIILSANRIKSQGVHYDHTSTPLDFYIAESYFFKGSLDSSKKYFIKSIEQSPFHLYSWSNIGAVYLKSGEDLKAIYSWEKAKEISNDFSEPRLNLALYYIGKNEFVEAERHLHYKIVNEDLTRYRSVWNKILDSFASHTIIYDSNDKKKRSLEDFKKNQQRKDWFIRTYCLDSLNFEKQMNMDIDYHIKNQCRLDKKY